MERYGIGEYYFWIEKIYVVGGVVFGDKGDGEGVVDS